MKDGDVWNNGKRGEQEEVKSHFCCRKKQKKKHQFRKHQGAISTRDMPRSRIGKRLADVESGWLHKLMTDLLGDERDQSSLELRK
jgi:hypothetical protein